RPSPRLAVAEPHLLQERPAPHAGPAADHTPAGRLDSNLAPAPSRRRRLSFQRDATLPRSSIQSAMKTFMSPGLEAFRFDAKTSFLPSGLNIGKPLKVPSVVTCS